MKYIYTILMICWFSSFSQDIKTSIYDFKIQSIDGGIIDFSAFKGKKIIIVNTASKCGYTYQYESLEKLYRNNKERLVIIGFPSDNFGGQEFDSDAKTAEFCKDNYTITFPLSTRVDVKGEEMHPIFKYLTQKKLNGVMDAEIKWNFYKFLIDRDGRLIGFYGSKVKPEDDEISGWVKE